MEVILSYAGWMLRRAATLALGEGPRSFTALAPIAGRYELLYDESGSAFPAPACRLVTPDLCGAADTWPMQSSQAPARQVWSVSDAGLYDDDGVIYDIKTRRAFEETLTYWHRPVHRHPALALRRAKPVHRLDGLSVFLGGLGGQTFYHFLVEILPKIPLLLPWLKKARRVVVQNYLEAEKTAWLRHLGIDLPIEWLQPLDHFHCEYLVFCPPLVADCRPGPETIRALRRITGAAEPSSGSRTRCLWATRVNANVRNMPWETDLIRALPAPWEAIDLGRLSPSEAIALGAQCVCFAGLHGAAFANLALWPAGVRVLEVYTQPHEPWYPALSLSAGHRHEVAFCNSPASLPAVLQELGHLATTTP